MRRQGKTWRGRSEIKRRTDLRSVLQNARSVREFRSFAVQMKHPKKLQSLVSIATVLLAGTFSQGTEVDADQQPDAGQMQTILGTEGFWRCHMYWKPTISS